MNLFLNDINILGTTNSTHFDQTMGPNIFFIIISFHWW